MRQVTHALLTRPPLSHLKWINLQQAVSIFGRGASFDLHVLSTPPAFILSQDQTLMFKSWFFQNLAWLNFRIQSRRTVTVFGCVFFWKRCDSAFESRSLNYSLTNLSRLFHCSVFNVLCLFDSLFILSKCFRCVKNFFNFFIFCCSVISGAIFILSRCPWFVNAFFHLF